MFKGVGVCFADFISFFLNITETKLFHFHRIFKNRDREWGSREPPLDPPLVMVFYGTEKINLKK